MKGEVVSIPRLRLWRSVALLVYCIGLAVLALLPVASIIVPEAIVGTFALLAAVWVLARLLPPHLPGEQYAYLVSGFAGVATAVGYTLGATSEPLYTRVGIALVILAGAIAAYNAYLDPDPSG